MTGPNTIFNDLHYWQRWPGMLGDIVPGEELELSRVWRIVCEGAASCDAERDGEAWLVGFIDFCERGGVAVLKARSDGSYVLVLADPLPSLDEAWSRITVGWPELEQATLG